MRQREKRDFPIHSTKRDSAHSLLKRVGGLEFSERYVAKLVAQGKLVCASGAIESFIATYQQDPAYRRGGHQTWKDAKPQPGYLTIGEAAKKLNYARSTIYGFIERDLLEAIPGPRRQFVTEASIDRFLMPPGPSTSAPIERIGPVSLR